MEVKARKDAAEAVEPRKRRPKPEELAHTGVACVVPVTHGVRQERVVEEIHLAGVSLLVLDEQHPRRHDGILRACSPAHDGLTGASW